MQIEDWCHFCLRVGYKDIKRYKNTEYSLCSRCRKCLEEILKKFEGGFKNG